MIHCLILGGTSQASALARALAERDIRATFSYAGRVARLKEQPVPVRVGGFGGVDGLCRYLHEHRVTHLVDATHPFAGQMSRHAVAAAQRASVALIALTRPPWQPEPGDRWHPVGDMEAAAAALAGPPRRVMLAIGRLHLAVFAAQPQHHYLLRLADAPAAEPPLPHHRVVVDRGPFTLAGDLDLLKTHRIDSIVCKNSGGDAAAAKLTAARQLELPVIMVERPPVPARREAYSVTEVVHWLTREPSGACTAEALDPAQ